MNGWLGNGERYETARYRAANCMSGPKPVNLGNALSSGTEVPRTHAVGARLFRWLNTTSGSPLQTATLDSRKPSVQTVTQIMRKVYSVISIAASAFRRESRAYHPGIQAHSLPKSQLRRIFRLCL